jgi:hypothetical protein
MEENKKKSLLWPIISLILLLGIIGLVIWLVTTRSHLNQMIEEKEIQRVELKKELDSLMVQHERVKMEYGELTDSLKVKDSVIQANAIEIKKLLNTQWEYYKVKKKLTQLQGIAQGYVRQMDSLYRVNDALTQENIEIKRDLEDLREEKAEIEKDRQVLSGKIDIASALQAYNLNANGIRFRSGGKKEVETDKAKKVEQVKVCFTIGENEITEPGKKDIYIRIARPDKEILTRTRDDEYTFDFKGEKLQYSIFRTIDYQNMPIDICVYWSKQYSAQDLPTGLYHVDVFSGDEEIGHTTFSLR